ncbi:MAG: type II toxin-antitoxin system HicB family antitoxin [Bacteroidetes bacterium]|nr:type II toxin-antitoxin system HicB family antitoxin [Bacteroidota bacterium]
MELKQMTFTAVFLEVPEGGYSAYIEEIPGANSQGETLDEARSNLTEALKMILETNKILSQKNQPYGLKSYREPLSFA